MTLLSEYSVACLLGMSVASLSGVFVLLLMILYCYLKTTSVVDPDLELSRSESMFVDPSTGDRTPFPRTALAPPTLYLSLVVPAYKEQERLPKMMDETMAYLEQRQKRDSTFEYEVIIVNDGSPDRTAEEALKYVVRYGTDKVRLLDFSRNRGKGGAVRMGSLCARGERILFLDADGATEVADMEHLEKALDEIASDHNQPALAVGSRAHLQEEAVAQRSVFRNFLMYCFHLLVYVLCVRGIRDTQCGFKMMTRSAAVLLYQTLHINRWAFDVELLYIAQHLNMPVREVAVNWQEIEGSKMVPIFSWMEMGRDLVFIRARYFFGIWSILSKHKKH